MPEKNDAIVPEYSKSENLQLHEISTVALQAVHHGKAWKEWEEKKTFWTWLRVGMVRPKLARPTTQSKSKFKRTQAATNTGNGNSSSTITNRIGDEPCSYNFGKLRRPVLPKHVLEEHNEAALNMHSAWNDVMVRKGQLDSMRVMQVAAAVWSQTWPKNVRLNASFPKTLSLSSNLVAQAAIERCSTVVPEQTSWISLNAVVESKTFKNRNHFFTLTVTRVASSDIDCT